MMPAVYPSHDEFVEYSMTPVPLKVNKGLAIRPVRRTIVMIQFIFDATFISID